MTTTLKRFSDAYASLTVAVYEPMIVRWFAGWTIRMLAADLAWRAYKGKNIDLNKPFATAHALTGLKRNGVSFGALIRKLGVKLGNPRRKGEERAVDGVGNFMPDGVVQRVNIPNYPDAILVDGQLYPFGALTVHAARARDKTTPRASLGRHAGAGDSTFGARSVPVAMNRRMGRVDDVIDLGGVRKELFEQMIEGAKEALKKDAPLAPILTSVLGALGQPIYSFFPISRIEEALSPIGLAHYYRQLYFVLEEGVGPIEQAFTVAPLETLEVQYESTRRQVQEESVEIGSEQISERASEEKNLDEVSDKVSSMLQRDTSASMSLTGSYSTPVWQLGATASASMAVSSQRSSEHATHQLKETTARASERLTKTFSIKTRSLDELVTTNRTKRVIQNNGDEPVSYGLRRVLRKVRVKVQDLGPRLVWQTYIREPGAGLAQASFVNFRPTEIIPPPDVPPGVPPRPAGGKETGTTSCNLQYDGERETCFVTLRIQETADRVVTAMTIESMTDLEGGGKDDPAPAPRNELQWGQSWDEDTHTFVVNIAVLAGDSLSLSINYSYTWDPSQAVLDEWERLRAAAVAALTEQALQKQFDEQKATLTEASKIRTRPANDLRREERFEVMGRMVAHLFGRGDDPAEPTPLEIEYFHRFFELERMFIYNHPSWWRPRYSRNQTQFAPTAYQITADSEPAPLGSSLGWKLQLDGDSRRNEFLNSPWARVCLPIQPGREREALEWLKAHIEGDIGFAAGPVEKLVKEVEARRGDEENLGQDGPNYVTVDSTVGAPAGPLSPQQVYPVVSEFDATVPTDGFVYDELLIDGDA